MLKMTNRLLLLSLLAGMASAQPWDQVIADYPGTDLIVAALTDAEILPNDSVPSDPFLTLFVPLNSAFTSLEEDEPELYNQFFVDEAFTAHRNAILDVHAVVGQVLSTDIEDGAVIASSYGSDEFAFSVSGEGNETMVTIAAPNSVATVVDADNLAENAVVHFIDNFLLPSFLTDSVLEVLEENHGILLSLLDTAGLELPEDTPVTILAPSDAAFEALGQEMLDFLQDPMNKDVLSAILLNHIVVGVSSFDDLFELSGQTVEAVSGEFLSIVVMEGLDGDLITVNDIAVVDEDVFGNDGIIHVIDAVIVFDGQLPTGAPTTSPVAAPTNEPDTIVAIENTTAPTTAPVDMESPAMSSVLDYISGEADLTKTATLFTEGEVADMLCSDCIFTTFAPVDSAYSNTRDRTLSLVQNADQSGYTEHRKNFLQYHVSKEQDMLVFARDFAASVPVNETAKVNFEMLNGENVTLTAFNGTVTVNDETVVEADIEVGKGVIHKLAQFLEPEFWDLDLFDLGESFPEYTVVFRLIKAVGIRSSLPGEYTLFVPDDDAFKKFGETNIQALENSISENGNFLLNHVIEGVLPLDALKNGMTVEAVGEQFLKFEVTDDGVFVNGAKIIESNVLAKNGIAFGIDTVLEFEEPTDAPTATPEGSAASTVSLLGAAAALLLALW